MEMLSWVMCGWSVLTRWSLAEQRYKTGWTMMLLGQVGWGILAAKAGLPGMLAYSFISVIIAIRGIYKQRVVQRAQTQETK